MMKKRLFAAFLLSAFISVALQAGNYKNFKVSTYVRAQDVARMADKNFLESTWKTISEQVDIDKIYLETHRDAFIVDEKVLVKVKNFFQKQGLEVGGGITYTISEPSDFETYSYARPADRQKVREIAEYTAKHFDDFILDDFFFIDIKNDDEIAAKGSKSWTDYRLRLMADAGKELVVGPAKKVNPKMKVIIKYPNWYDHFHGLGFNLVNADKDFMDISSIGGLCVTYTSDDPVLVEIASPEVPDAKACGSALLAQSSPAPQTLAWSSFEQPSWVAQSEKIDCSIAIAKATQVKFKVDGGAAEMTGKLRIFEVGPQGTCSGNKSVSSSEPSSYSYGDSPNLPGGSTPGAIKAAKAPASVKAVLSGRTLSFSGITSGATYEIVSLQGQVVKSGVVASSVSLASLNAGIYMVRVSGNAVNMNQKIILK